MQTTPVGGVEEAESEVVRRLREVAESYSQQTDERMRRVEQLMYVLSCPFSSSGPLPSTDMVSYLPETEETDG